MAADRNAVIAMGQTEFVRRWNMGSSEKKALAEMFGFASVASLGNAVNHRGLGWIAGGEGNGDTERKPRQSTNSVSAIRQAIEDMQSVGLISEVPSLHVGPVDQLVVNPAIAAMIQPFFDATPLNAAFVLAFRHVPTSQLREFGITSPEMREQEKAEKQAILDRELEAKAFLKTRGWEVVVADHLAADISIWSLRLIESSDFEIGLIHAAETAAAAAETERLAAIAAAAAVEQAARLHDAQTVSESLAIDASEREKAALQAAQEQADKNAALQAQIAAMQQQMAELLAASKPATSVKRKAA